MIEQKLLDLDRAAQAFKAELLKFQTAYDPETVGILEFCDHIDDVIFEIRAEVGSLDTQ